MVLRPDGVGEDIGPVLLYDGDCGLCAGSVQFVLAHESSARPATLRFAPLQGILGTRLRAENPSLAGTDSVLWLERNRDGDWHVEVRSTAALRALSYLGGGWRVLAFAGRLVPRPLRDVVYDVIARRRQRLVAPACHLPTVEQRVRFLE